MFKFGIIGTNFISDWMCEASVQVCDIALHAVCSRSEEKGREFALRHKIPHVFTDIEAFMQSDLDAVYIASPNFLHYPYAKMALEHQKHVLVEKPACLSASEFESLCTLASQKGLLVMEAMRPAHDPAVLHAKKVMQSGAIGKIRSACFEYCQYSSRYDKYRAHEILNAFNPAFGNAALMDIGVYAVHSAVIFFEQLELLHAKSTFLDNGMEGIGSALLQAIDGTPVQVLYSKITESCNPSVIMGEDGHIIIRRLSSVDEVTVVSRATKSKEVLCKRPRSDMHENMKDELSDFILCLSKENSVAPFNAQTLHTLQLMDSIRHVCGIRFA